MGLVGGSFNYQDYNIVGSTLGGFFVGGGGRSEKDYYSMSYLGPCFWKPSAVYSRGDGPRLVLITGEIERLQSKTPVAVSGGF